MLKIRYKATTPDQRALGLSSYPQLHSGEAMLLKWTSPEMISVWNRGVSYDIDLAFFDESGKMLSKHSLKADNGKDQTPLVFSPMPAKYVLEANKGELTQYNVGTKLSAITNEKSKN